MRRPVALVGKQPAGVEIARAAPDRRQPVLLAQRAQPGAVHPDHGVGQDGDGLRAFPGDRRERRIEIVGPARSRPAAASRPAPAPIPGRAGERLGPDGVRIEDDGEPARRRQDVLQQLQALLQDAVERGRDAGDVAARPRQARRPAPFAPGRPRRRRRSESSSWPPWRPSPRGRPSGDQHVGCEPDHLLQLTGQAVVAGPPSSGIRWPGSAPRRSRVRASPGEAARSRRAPRSGRAPNRRARPAGAPCPPPAAPASPTARRTPRSPQRSQRASATWRRIHSITSSAPPARSAESSRRAPWPPSG